MIVMKKVRSGTYYTGQDRDGYASVEREGVRLGLEFVWSEPHDEERPVEPPGRERPQWQAWKIVGSSVRRRRQVARVIPTDEETATSERKPWDGQRKTFGLMAIPAVDIAAAAEMLDHIVRDGLPERRHESEPAATQGKTDGAETGFLVVDREGELVTVSIYGAGPEALLGKTAHEKIRQVMDVLTGRWRPSDRRDGMEDELPLPARQRAKNRPWMDSLAVRPESIRWDREGTDNVWWGGLAARLGVEGAVIGRDDLELALNGYVPGLVEGKPVPVMSNAGHPRRRKGTDIVFSAPKAYSLLWAQSDPAGRKALERLNRETVRRTLAWWVEKGLGFSQEDNGRQCNHERDLLVGLFEHGSSRGKDPHLHTHCIVVNLTGNGKRLIINNRYTLAADYEYRRGLCAGLQQMGYPAFPSLEQGFGIKGIGNEDEERFSRRRQMILELAGGRGPQARRRIALLTRRAKVNSREEIHGLAGDGWGTVGWEAVAAGLETPAGQTAPEWPVPEWPVPEWPVPEPGRNETPWGAMGFPGASEPDLVRPEPARPEPARPEPVRPEPVRPEPVAPVPVAWPASLFAEETAGEGPAMAPWKHHSGAGHPEQKHPGQENGHHGPAREPAREPIPEPAQMPDGRPETGAGAGAAQSAQGDEKSVISPLDIVRRVTLNRGQVVAMDEDVIGLARLMHTRGGQSPDDEEIRQWLAGDDRITTRHGWWIEAHLLETDRRCREKISALMRENRVTIIDGTGKKRDEPAAADICWLFPGEIPPEKNLREEQKFHYIGLRHAHWWTAGQLEPLLDSLRGRLVLEMPLDGPSLPGYPARELWWQDESVRGTREMAAGMKVGPATRRGPAATGEGASAEKTPEKQLALPLETRRQTPTRKIRNLKDGYYQNASGFHARADEFIANFGYDVMLHRQVVMIGEKPEAWETVIEQKLLDMGLIAPAPAGEFKGLSWRINERVGWRPQSWKRDDWLWGEVWDITCEPGRHAPRLWVGTWKGGLVELKEEDVQSIRCGYVVQPSEIRDGHGLRCHYYFPRPAERNGSRRNGGRYSGEERRREVTQAMRDRPLRGQLLIGIEPYRKRWHAPPHAEFLESENKGLPGIGPTGAGSSGRVLGLVRALCHLGGGHWQLVDRTGTTDLPIVPREEWDRRETGRTWESHVLESVAAVTTGRDQQGPWFLQWAETDRSQRWLIVRVETMNELLAMQQGGLSVELVTRLEEGYDVWMTWPRYENRELTPEALDDYLRQMCGMETFARQERGEIPSALWKCAPGNPLRREHELSRLPMSTWEKMRPNQAGIKEKYPGMEGR